MAENSTVTYSTLIPKEEIVIDLKAITNGKITGSVDTKDLAWSGDGYLDVLLNAINDNIFIQRELGRITKEDYAQIYTQLIAECLRQAIQLAALSKDNLLKWQQAVNKDKTDKLQQEVLLAQIKTYQRQLEGFDDNVQIKLLQAQLDAFSTIYASGMLDEVDTGPLNVSNLNSTYRAVKERAEKIKTYNIDDRITVPKSKIDL